MSKRYTGPIKSKAQILRDAADIIERDGWWQHGFDSGNSKDGPCCASGALYRAAYGLSDPEKLSDTHMPYPYRSVVSEICDDVRYILPRFPEKKLDLHLSLHAWNDSVAKYEHEVTGELRKWAERYDDRA